MFLLGTVPYFVEHLQDYYSNGADVILSATANGDPAVSYQWFRNGMAITDEDTTPDTRFSVYLNLLLHQIGHVYTHKCAADIVLKYEHNLVVE